MFANNKTTNIGAGNGNGSSATSRPPLGGEGAAGWDEGTSQFGVPQSVVPPVSAPIAANTGPVQEPAEGDSFPRRPPDYGNNLAPPMRPPTPPANHWSVRRPA
jgi:hypothetical protein